MREVNAATRSPVLRALGWADVVSALRSGAGDLLRAPLLGLALGGIIALGGLISLLSIVSWNAGWIAMMIAVVFPLIFPFIAAGLYETSRRLARGEPRRIGAIVATMLNQRERQLGWMAFVVLFIFWVWVYQVRILLALFFGFGASANLGRFVVTIATTPNGWSFIAVGSAVGLIIALFLFAITLVSMPLLFESDIDFVTAMILSVGTVTRSAVPLLGFGVLATAATILSILSGFLGFFVLVPRLGHTAWHLYQRACIRSGAPTS